MRAIAPFIGVLAVLLTGCGGSNHSSSSTGSAAGAATSVQSSATASASTTATQGQPSATMTTATSAPAGSGTTGATNVRIPATFTIRKGPTLDPPTVSAPAFIAIQLTLISGDGARHRVVVLASTKHVVTVPARGRASITLPGLKAGRYVITVDNAGGGALLIGAEPGP